MEHVDLFCETLRKMKESAPISLKLNVAVSASRDVIYKGEQPEEGRDPALELRELDQLFRLQRERTRHHELG
jgi:hypothetical protein